MPHGQPAYSMLTNVALLLGLIRAVAAQSNATGDLSKAAPYGIPPAAFQSATSNLTLSAIFPIPGYDVSVPAGSDPGGNGSAATGWELGVAVAADVPLSDAAGSGIADSDSPEVTEATTLSILAPRGMSFDPSWIVCATVYAGLASGAETARESTPGSSSSGTCSELLSGECIKQLAVVAETKGVAADGSCASAGIPDTCVGQFAEGSSAFPLNADIIAANRFFAYGSPPTLAGNATALSQAEGNVWPVILTWAHLSAEGSIQASNAYLACVRAGNSTSTSSGGGSGTGIGTPGQTPASGESAIAPRGGEGIVGFLPFLFVALALF